MKPLSHKIILVFYPIFSLFIGIYNLWSYVGMTTDSKIYILGAISIFENGFFSINVVSLNDVQNIAPIVKFPPLYSITISLLIFFGFKPIFAARIISVLAYSASFIPLFFLSKKFTSPLFAHLCCISWIVFYPGILCARYAWSETLFVLLLLLSFFLLSEETERSRLSIHKITKKEFIFPLTLGSLTGLATITRWIGIIFSVVVFFIFGVIYIMTVERRRFLMKIGIMATGWTIPVFPVFIINLISTSTIFGVRASSSDPISENTKHVINSLIRSFLFFGNVLDRPNIIMLLIGFFITFFIILPISVSKGISRNFTSFYRVLLFRMSDSASTYIFLIVPIIIYIIFLIVLRSISYFDPISFRLMFPCYPFVLILIFRFLKDFTDIFNQEILLQLSSELFIFHKQELRGILISLSFLAILFPQILHLTFDNDIRREKPGFETDFPTEYSIDEGLLWIIHNTKIGSVILTNRGVDVNFYTKRTSVELAILSYYGYVNTLQDIEIGVDRHNISHLVLFRDVLDIYNYGQDVIMLSTGKLFPENWKLLLQTNHTIIYAC